MIFIFSVLSPLIFVVLWVLTRTYVTDCQEEKEDKQKVKNHEQNGYDNKLKHPYVPQYGDEKKELIKDYSPKEAQIYGYVDQHVVKYQGDEGVYYGDEKKGMKYHKNAYSKGSYGSKGSNYKNGGAYGKSMPKYKNDCDEDGVKYVFPQRHVECVEDSTGCEIVCATDVCKNGPSLNPNCKADCDLQLNIQRILYGMQCSIEMIAVRNASGLTCDSDNQSLIEALNKYIHQFADLFCPQFTNEEGKERLMCCLKEYFHEIRRYMGLIVKIETAKFKCPETQKRKSQEWKIEKERLLMRIKNDREKICKSIAVILPTIESTVERITVDKGEGYVYTVFRDLANLSLEQLTNVLKPKSTPCSKMVKCNEERIYIITTFAQSIATALACSFCLK